MKKNIAPLIMCAVAIVSVIASAGCMTSKCKIPASARADEHKGRVDPTVTITYDSSDPTPSAGTLTIPVSSFTSGNGQQNCFPYANGWNRYYVTFYFLGPNVSPLPDPNNYPNPDNVNSVTVHTCDPLNGSTLDTGIVIMEDLDPTQKVCNNNASPTYAPNPKLSSATFSPTKNNTKYRATVFYKNSTVGSLQNITVRWSYP